MDNYFCASCLRLLTGTGTGEPEECVCGAVIDSRDRYLDQGQLDDCRAAENRTMRSAIESGLIREPAPKWET